MEDAYWKFVTVAVVCLTLIILELIHSDRELLLAQYKAWEKS